jgi:hypothetical protein
VKSKKTLSAFGILAISAFAAVLSVGCSGELPQSPTGTSVALPDSGDGMVHAMSNGTLRVTVGVNNDDGAWFGANHVAIIRVDGTTDYRVGNPEDYAWQDSVSISLSPGPHTVTLINDIPNLYFVESSNVGNVTISSGVTTDQGADFNDCTYLSC